MCGVVAYVGVESPVPRIMDGLRRLEYRGYDSSGIACLTSDGIAWRKAAGKLGNLERSLAGLLQELEQDDDAAPETMRLGIGHTRWATHGAATDRNAHPHLGPRGEVAIVHNGIIENFTELRQAIIAQGGTLASDTDTEVIAHLLEAALETEADTLSGLRQVVRQLRGAYALTILVRREPERLFALRQQVPLVIGRGEVSGVPHYMIASDTLALPESIAEIMHLQDGEVAALSLGGLALTDANGATVTPHFQPFAAEGASDGKAGYPDYMLKEIHEQPSVVRRLLAAPVPLSVQALLQTARRLLITGCGTSLNAALIGKYLIEDLASVPVIVEVAGELRYRNPCLQPGDLLLALSQSGETADTLAAVRLARETGLPVLALTNRPDSSLGREADAALPLLAGAERSVAATKSFIAQVVALVQVAGALANTPTRQRLDEGLRALPTLLDRLLADQKPYIALAERYAAARSLIFIGRGLQYPVALEAALKLKEISYIHAEGFSAAELKHGPLALLQPDLPVVALLAAGPLLEKSISNCQEAQARGAPVIVLCNAPLSPLLAAGFAQVIAVPPCGEVLAPILMAAATQLLAYHMAAALGRDIDQPRNLAKSVTVE